MINLYMLLRSAPFLLGALASMLNTNAWVEIMVGPDAWDYSPKELGVKAESGTDQYGFVWTSTLTVMHFAFSFLGELVS